MDFCWLTRTPVEITIEFKNFFKKAWAFEKSDFIKMKHINDMASKLILWSSL